MSKYAKYASWLAKAIVAIAAVTSAVLYFKTFDGVYLARFCAEVAFLLALDAMDELMELKKRIEIIESNQRVDNLTKTLSGD